jgi:hypothetical protein
MSVMNTEPPRSDREVLAGLVERVARRTITTPPLLSRLGPYEQHPAAAELKVGDLHEHRHPAKQDDFVATSRTGSLARGNPSVL